MYKLTLLVNRWVLLQNIKNKLQDVTSTTQTSDCLILFNIDSLELSKK